MKILLLNGPPRSGKDALGAMIADIAGARVAKFATELKEMIRGYYQARGWDKGGFVPIKKLQELEIASPVSGFGSTQNSKLETAK